MTLHSSYGYSRSSVHMLIKGCRWSMSMLTSGCSCPEAAAMSMTWHSTMFTVVPAFSRPHMCRQLLTPSDAHAPSNHVCTHTRHTYMCLHATIRMFVWCVQAAVDGALQEVLSQLPSQPHIMSAYGLAAAVRDAAMVQQVITSLLVLQVSDWLSYVRVLT